MNDRWYCPDCDVVRGEEGQRWYVRATVPTCGACGTTMQLVVVDPTETELEMVRRNKFYKSFTHQYTEPMTAETWQDVHTEQMTCDAVKDDHEIRVTSKFGTSVLQIVDGRRSIIHTAN